jgi:hypothetical protein
MGLFGEGSTLTQFLDYGYMFSDEKLVAGE